MVRQRKPTDPQPHEVPASRRETLILGSLQAGKSTLHQRLCGQWSLFREPTESTTKAQYGHLGAGSLGLLAGLRRFGGDAAEPSHHHLTDTPGTSSVLPQSEEEELVRAELLSGRHDSILLVADARNLRRSLALFLQVAEFGLPMVLCLNMADSAERQGLSFDAALLQHMLGVEVVVTNAREGSGLGRLRRALAAPRRPSLQVRYPRRIEELLLQLDEELRLPVSSRALGLYLLVGDPAAEALIESALGREVLDRVMSLVRSLRADIHLAMEPVLAGTFFRLAERVTGQVQRRQADSRRVAERLGHLAHHPVWGLPIAAVVVAAMYLWVGWLGATRVVDGLDAHLFQPILMPVSERLVAHIPWPIVREAVMDADFGLLPTGLFLAFGIVLPVLFFFYTAFAVLEQSGYLPRLAILLDRIFRRIGLNGRGVLPLAMGFSCVTMALITVRMLQTQRERVIASLLLMLCLPCAPLLAVMLVILADMPLSAGATVLGLLALQAVLAGLLLDRLLPGRGSDFIMEVPALRLPRPRRVLLHSARQTWAFMREAVPYFLAASLLLFIVDRLGGLALLESGARPITRGLLGLPDEAVQVFIKTLIRRENGATELDMMRGGFDGLQVVVTLITMTLLTPCVNSVIVLYKERGVGLASAIIAAVLVWGLAVGAATFHFCHWAGIDFAG